jgi:hypothetical protein
MLARLVQIIHFTVAMGKRGRKDRILYNGTGIYDSTLASTPNSPPLALDPTSPSHSLTPLHMHYQPVRCYAVLNLPVSLSPF